MRQSERELEDEEMKWRECVVVDLKMLRSNIRRDSAAILCLFFADIVMLSILLRLVSR